MSLTETEQVFAGVNEDAVNDLMTAIFTARPHYLNYGSPLFVPASTVQVTQVPAIPFPGVAGGVHYAVLFSIPHVDFHPDDSGGSSPLPPGLGQFTLTTTVRIFVGCTRLRDDDRGHLTHVPPPSVQPISAVLKIIARGRPRVRFFGAPGSGDLSLLVEEVEIVDITPNDLETVIECLIRMFLQAVLANVLIPFHALSMGAFNLILIRGPEVEQDQVQLYGNV